MANPEAMLLYFRGSICMLHLTTSKWCDCSVSEPTAEHPS